MNEVTLIIKSNGLTLKQLNDLAIILQENLRLMECAVKGKISIIIGDSHTTREGE